MGRVWAKKDEVKEVKEIEEVRERAGMGRMEEEICAFSDENMKEFSMRLARR